MIVFLILGGIFIIVGYIMGVRKFIKAYQYRGKAEGVIPDYENSTGTGKQNHGFFYPGKNVRCGIIQATLKNHI